MSSNIELFKLNRFFAEIGRKPYAIRIYEQDRHFKYESFMCSECGHHALTQCRAKQIPEDRAERIGFQPDVSLDGDSDAEMRFLVCDNCGHWHKKDFVQIIGDGGHTNINCKFRDCEIEITSELAETLELVFWDADVEDCLILYRLRNGNQEYMNRIMGNALTKDERQAVLVAIGKG